MRSQSDALWGLLGLLEKLEARRARDDPGHERGEAQERVVHSQLRQRPLLFGRQTRGGEEDSEGATTAGRGANGQRVPGSYGIVKIHPLNNMPVELWVIEIIIIEQKFNWALGRSNMEQKSTEQIYNTSQTTIKPNHNESKP